MSKYSLLGTKEQFTALQKFLRRAPTQGVAESRELLLVDSWLLTLKAAPGEPLSPPENSAEATMLTPSIPDPA